MERPFAWEGPCAGWPPATTCSWSRSSTRASSLSRRGSRRARRSRDRPPLRGVDLAPPDPRPVRRARRCPPHGRGRRRSVPPVPSTWSCAPTVTGCSTWPASCAVGVVPARWPTTGVLDDLPVPVVAAAARAGRAAGRRRTSSSSPSQQVRRPVRLAADARATDPPPSRLAPARCPPSRSLFAFVLLALAAARPEMEVRVPRENATVIVAVDVSNSMQATDVEPNRIEAASEAATKFVDDLPARASTSASSPSPGTTDVRAAPTADRETAMAALKGLTLGPRTAIGEGVFTSLDQIEAVASQAKRRRCPVYVVLLSDGTNTIGRTPGGGRGRCHEAGVPVSTIAYGTPDGHGRDRGPAGPGARRQGDPGRPRPRARTGGPTPPRAATSSTRSTTTSSRSIGYRTEPREVTPYVGAPRACCFGLLAAALSLRWFSRLP